MDIEEIQEAIDDYKGYCKHCEAFTTDRVEGDADGYTCDECGKNDVCGAENALLMGLL